MRRNLWRVAATAALVATLAMAGGSPAVAAISTSAFCVNVRAGTSGFTDIGDVGAAQRSDIECLATSGITSGTGAGTYSPRGTVFRDSMATFVAKLVDLANGLERVPLQGLAASGADAFTDDAGNTHEGNINRLAAAGIVRGKGPQSYGPNGAGNEVTRAQMATFLVAAIDFMRPAALAAAPDAFTDDAGNTHEASINKLAAIDVVDGVTATTYNPNGTLSRAQMASFLIRTLAFLEAQGQITPLPSGTETIRLSPSGAVENQTDATAGTDDVSFTASAITAPDVDIVLLPCENVGSANGAATFTDANPDDNVADPGADRVEADIVAVNGTNRDPNTEAASAIPVTSGAITFTVDSPAPDCVVAVVWDDADDDDRLDLNTAGVPTERFGRTGLVTFVPPPAAAGAMDENVVTHDGARDRFVGCELGGAPTGAGPFPEEGPNAASLTDCFTFTYDNGDVFNADPDGAGPQPGTVLSLDEFETALTSGDDVFGDYAATPAGQSTFRVVDEAPAAPGGASASAVDGDTIVVTFNEVEFADSYTVFVNPDPNSSLSCPGFATTGADPYAVAGTVAGGFADADAGTTNTLTHDGLTPSTRYCYVVVASDEGDTSPPSSAVFATTTADVTPPVALDTELTTSANAVIDANDVIQICFDQDIADPATDAPPTGDAELLRLRDVDGTEATLTQGGNAGFRKPATAVAVGAAGAPVCAALRVLEVVVNSAPAPTATGSNSVLDLPVTIVAADQIEDTAGTQFQPAGDPDVVIDVEGGGEPN